ncbi:MAG: hypothetical protein HY749_16170 [Gammaproteobacteria bacterium]|nr:hypothetical protein [Gammaproteobacteria bacterium]
MFGLTAKMQAVVAGILVAIIIGLGISLFVEWGRVKVLEVKVASAQTDAVAYKATIDKFSTENRNLADSIRAQDARIERMKADQDRAQSEADARARAALGRKVAVPETHGPDTLNLWWGRLQ